MVSSGNTHRQRKIGPESYDVEMIRDFLAQFVIECRLYGMSHSGADKDVITSVQYELLKIQERRGAPCLLSQWEAPENLSHETKRELEAEWARHRDAQTLEAANAINGISTLLDEALYNATGWAPMGVRTFRNLLSFDPIPSEPAEDGDKLDDAGETLEAV